MNRQNPTLSILGKAFLNKAYAEDYINWAEEMLVQGYNSSNLRILAGLDRKGSVIDIKPYFEESLKELKIERIAPETAVRAYAFRIAQRVVDGSTSEIHKNVYILSQIFTGMNYALEYETWHELYNALWDITRGCAPHSWLYPAITLESFDAIAKQEAKAFIAKLTEQS